MRIKKSENQLYAHNIPIIIRTNIKEKNQSPRERRKVYIGFLRSHKKYTFSEECVDGFK